MTDNKAKKNQKTYPLNEIRKDAEESLNIEKEHQIGKHYNVNFFELESLTVECPFGHRWDLRQIHEMSSWGDQSCPECQTMAKWIVSVNESDENDEDSDLKEASQNNKSRGPGVLPDDYFKSGLS